MHQVPPSLALTSATTVIAIPLLSTHSISCSDPGPFLAFNPSVVTLAIYGLNSEAEGEALSSKMLFPFPLVQFLIFYWREKWEK